MEIYHDMVMQGSFIFFYTDLESGSVSASNPYTNDLLGMYSIVGCDFYSFFDVAGRDNIRKCLFTGSSEPIDVNLVSSYNYPIPASIVLKKTEDNFCFAFGINSNAETRRCRIYSEGDAKALLQNFEEDKSKRAWQLDNIDPVTGLFNRNFYEKVFQKQYKKTMEDNEDIGVILMDIDDFELLNNKYGYIKCDSILSGFSQVIYAHIRNTDFAIRYDDDCFLILLANVKIRTLSVIAERIRENVQRYLGISVSVGCTSLETAGIDAMDGLVRVALKALELSKQHGKNMVTVA